MAKLPTQTGEDTARGLIMDNYSTDPSVTGADVSDDGDDDTGDVVGDDAGSVDQLDEQRQQPGEQRAKPQKDLRQRVSHTQPDRNLKADKKGNLVDAQGKVIVRAGNERRFYSEAMTARQEVATHKRVADETNQRLQRAVEIGRELHTELTQFKAQSDQLKQLGMTPQDQLNAMQFYSELRNDPTNTVRRLLTKLAADGIDIQAVGGGGAIDMKSISELIKNTIGEQMTPLKKRTEADEQRQRQERENNEALAKTQNEVNTFFQDNPDALAYAPHIKEILSQPQFRHMSLGEVWARLQLNLERSQRNPPNNRRKPSIPGGRGRPAEGDADNSGMAPVNMRFEDIVKGVLKDNREGRLRA